MLFSIEINQIIFPEKSSRGFKNEFYLMRK